MTPQRIQPLEQHLQEWRTRHADAETLRAA
jgi:hypothetical protein